MLVFLSLIFWLSLLAFLWTYAGYPLWIYLRSRSQPLPVARQDWQPKITLLIPVFNEIDVIQRKLNNTLQLDYPAEKLQIIVVDDASDDGTLEILRTFQDKGITLIEKKRRSGKMASVNLGMAQATGEIVVLSDASPNYERDALRYLVRPFADDKVGVVVGTLALWDAQNAVAKPAGLYWKYEAALRHWESNSGSTIAVHGNMYAIRKSAYRPLREETINDEFTLTLDVMRQGLRVLYEPDAMSYDDASSSMQEEFKRRVRINAGRFQTLVSFNNLQGLPGKIVFRILSHKVLRSLAPLLMINMLLSNALAFLLYPQNNNGLFFISGIWALLLLLAQIAFYGLGILGWLAEKSGKHSKLLSVPYFFTMTNLAALVGLWRWLRGKQSVTWQKRSSLVK